MSATRPRLTRAARRAGSARVALGRLRLPGRCRLAISATDDARNESARRFARFRIRG